MRGSVEGQQLQAIRLRQHPLDLMDAALFAKKQHIIVMRGEVLEDLEGHLLTAAHHPVIFTKIKNYLHCSTFSL